MSSMTYLYFTSKHTHPLRKTNNNPIYDCDKLYSNIQGEILLSQNKMLMTSKDLWINLLLSKLSLIKSNLIIYIKLCEDIISDIFSLHPHWSGKIHSTFFWVYPFILLKRLLAMVCCGIINNANLRPLVDHPPTIISMFIKKTPKDLLTQIFAANTKYFTPYWIGGPKNISFVGSSMCLFQN